MELSKLNRLSAIGFAVTSIFATHALATANNAPHTMNYNGYLSSAAGIPENGNFDMKFGILLNGTRIWYAEYTTVAISSGQLSVVLGGTSQGGQALDPLSGATINNTNLPISSNLISSVTSATSVTLVVEVYNGSGFEQLAPSFPISSALFALQAETVGGYDSSLLAKQDGSGNILSSGNVAAINSNGDFVGPALILPNASAPAPAAGKGIIYFDSITHTFQASENGAGYVTLLSSGGAGTLSGLTAGQVPYATSANSVTTNGNLKFDSVNNVFTLDASNAPTGDALVVASSPHGSATTSLVRLGPADIAGGNAQGTYIGANAANGYAGDLVDLQVNGTKEFVIDASGNVTATGKTKTATFQVTTGASSGYVLTSDASGNATWAAASGGSGTVTGTGTINQITKWSNTTGALVDSLLSDDATTVTLSAGKNFTMAAGTGTFTTGTGAVSVNGNATMAAGKNFSFTGATAGTLTEKVPATVTSYSITWPSAVAGTSGQVLTSDTSGNLSWTTPTGSGTVNSGTAGQMAYYSGTGTAVSGDANATISNGALTLGQAGTTMGDLILSGNTSGTVTLAPQAAAGTYNFNLPTSAGSAGQPLLSGGGGASAMTFGTLGVSGGGTGATTLTAHGVLLGEGTSAVTATAAGAAGSILQGAGASDPSFTATPTLGVNATTTGKLALANGAGGGASTTIQPNASTTVAWTFTLPSDKGTNGFVLQTDGSGNTAWAPPTGLTGLNAGQVVYATGATSIATAADFAWDNVNHKLTIDASNAPTGNALQISSNPAGGAANALLTLGSANIAGGSIQGTYLGANAPNGYTGYFIEYENNSAQAFRVDSSGSVVTAGSLTATGGIATSASFTLPATSATVGQLIQAGTNILHTFGTHNFFSGANAGNTSTITGSGNAGVGTGAINALTSGSNNAAIGYNALNQDSTGSSNSAVGMAALINNTTGAKNTAVGFNALYGNTTSNENTAVGYLALNINTSGANNTAIGSQTLVSNTTSNGNTAVGYSAFSNSTSSGNTALGYNAGTSLLSGTNNTYVGNSSGTVPTSGSNLTLIGTGAQAADTNLSNATAIGASAIVNASNSTAIGSSAVVNTANSIVLGASGISVGVGVSSPGYTLDVENTSSGSTVAYFSDGTKNCTVIPASGVSCSSDVRLKTDIQDLDESLKRIQQLRGVSYLWKDGSSKKRSIGFIAQELEDVFPEFVSEDKNGMKRVNYANFVAVLTNGIKELYAKLLQTDSRVDLALEENAQLKKELDALRIEIEQLKKQANH